MGTRSEIRGHLPNVCAKRLQEPQGARPWHNRFTAVGLLLVGALTGGLAVLTVTATLIGPPPIAVVIAGVLA